MKNHQTSSSDSKFISNKQITKPVPSFGMGSITQEVAKHLRRTASKPTPQVSIGMGAITQEVAKHLRRTATKPAPQVSIGMGSITQEVAKHLRHY
jgi:RNA-binding protein YhbY